MDNPRDFPGDMVYIVLPQLHVHFRIASNCDRALSFLARVQVVRSQLRVTPTDVDFMEAGKQGQIQQVGE